MLGASTAVPTSRTSARRTTTSRPRRSSIGRSPTICRWWACALAATAASRSTRKYLSVFLCCVLGGSTEPGRQADDRVARALDRNPFLWSSIGGSRRTPPAGDPVKAYWVPDVARVRRVVVKNARGHALHELSEPARDEPAHVVAVTRSGGFSRNRRCRAAFRQASWQYRRLSSVPAGKGVRQCRPMRRAFNVARPGRDSARVRGPRDTAARARRI